MARVSDQELVKELLSKDEGSSTLDFKSTPYRFDNEHYKALFVKDVVCMANTPRVGSAHILLGIHCKPDGTKEIIGVNEHTDDAHLQQLVDSWVRPVPKFQYRTVQYEELNVGILEVFPRRGGPYLSTREYRNKLRRDVIYFRRGSSNSEARPEEIREIVEWMSAPDEPKTESIIPISTNASSWDKFYNVCNKFEQGWIYCLAIGPDTTVSRDQKAVLGRIDWSLVLDFDTETHISGTYAATEPELKTARAVHLLTLNNRPFLNLVRGTYWFAAAGLTDVPTTLAEDNWRGWYRKCSEGIRCLASSFARAASETPVMLIVLWDEPDYVRTICESFDGACGDSTNLVFAAKEVSRLSSIADTFHAQSIAISLGDICNGLEHMMERRSSEAAIRLPTLESGPVSIPQERLRWLEEDLELVHLDTGQTIAPTCNPRRDFLQGKLISWAELAIHCDVDRDRTSALQGKVERDLEDRAIRRNSLYHWPGAGGTTVARRVVWNLHLRYPTVQLRRIVPGETIERLRYIFDLTRMPLLVLVEGADVSMTVFDQLLTEVLTRQLRSVYLTVLRTFEHKTEDAFSVFLDSTLSVPESQLFAKTYTEMEPERGTQLESIVHSRDGRQRTPFCFGLTAFGRDFVSISDYVSRRLETATDTQRQILTILAMVYHYGQKAVPAQMFAGTLGVPERRIVRLESVLPEPLKELTVREDELRWRPMHELIAAEILESVLQGTAADRRLWKQSLSTWVQKLIKVFSTPNKVPSDELMGILSRIFMFRDYAELMQSPELSVARPYAPIIQDIPSNEGRLGAFQKLVEAFPDEPHFWGHLGRFYAIELQRDQEALEAIDTAIELDSKNNVFYHMKGMVVRQELYRFLDKLKQQGCCSSGDLETIQHKVKDAGELFEKSRSLAAPQEEHAYVSHIQLLIRVVDLGFAISNQPSRDGFLISEDAAWYRELIDAAEHLLEELRRKQEGGLPSLYTMRCQTGLDGLYGDYSRVLQAWNTLLDRRDVYLPTVRRQIARIYLVRKNRSWDELDQRELRRIAELMQENIETDPADHGGIRYWFQAVRRIDGQSIEGAIERLSYWKANTSEPLEATFYLHILYTLQSLEGLTAPVSKASNLQAECSTLARNLTIRHKSIEWYGKGVGMKRILHHSQLSKPREKEFEEGEMLSLVDGRVYRIFGPEGGQIELSCGLLAFFVPQRGFKRSFVRSRDENRAVRFYLSFTYDGLRAWAVRDAS